MIAYYYGMRLQTFPIEYAEKPKDGFLFCLDEEKIKEFNIPLWRSFYHEVIAYNRLLTKEEIERCDLVYIGEINIIKSK